MQHSTEALEREIKTLEERLQQARRDLQALRGGGVQDDGVLELIELTENDIIEEPDDRLVERMVPPARMVADPWAGVAVSELLASNSGEAEEPPALPAAASAGRDPLMTGTLAELYVSQGFIDKALGIYQDILAAEPGNDAVATRLAELELQQQSAGLPEAADKEGTAEAFAAVPVLSAAVDNTGILTVLEGWLDNIRRLRACR